MQIAAAQFDPAAAREIDAWPSAARSANRTAASAGAASLPGGPTTLRNSSSASSSNAPASLTGGGIFDPRTLVFLLSATSAAAGLSAASAVTVGSAVVSV